MLSIWTSHITYSSAVELQTSTLLCLTTRDNVPRWLENSESEKNRMVFLSSALSLGQATPVLWYLIHKLGMRPNLL